MTGIGGSRRFRVRLTAAFVAVAAVSAGLVATVTFLLAREYRWRNLRNTAVEETRLALALGPQRLDEESFERFLAAYERRTDAHILAIVGEQWLSSSDFDPSDVPSSLGALADDPTLVEAKVDGRSMFVSGAVGRGDVNYYVFFSLDQLHDSLDELARSAVVAWLGTLALAAAVGSVVARRTLRPVARAALAAEAIAGGDLDARLDVGANDEFGTLARSFNRMADEVQSSIRRSEAAAQRERRFTADVAHELRTPLTGMSGAADLLAAELDELPGSSQRPARLLVEDVGRLRWLVSELLELATLEAATDEPVLVELDVDAAVRAVVADAATRRSASIAVDIEPNSAVLSEPSAFRSILGNLIDNAITHGGGDVNVRARSMSDGTTTIDVLDRGPGLGSGPTTEVFERFHKADRSRSGGGAGLGLAIAREHAARQGGSLSARSRRTGGARFTLTLLTPIADRS